MKRETAVITVRVTPREARTIERLALADGRSIGQLTRKVIRDWMKQQQAIRK